MYHNDTHYQQFVLVPGTGPYLLGREPYKDLFTAGLGKLEEVTAKLYFDETVQPRYCKPRPVPLIM